MRASVIVPTYNRPDLLRRALVSLRNQTMGDFEVIVVNDGGASVNDVIDEFSDLYITYVEHMKNKGLSAARNSGLHWADGDYIAYLDDDDEFLPHHLEALIDKGAMVAYSRAMILQERKNSSGRWEVYNRTEGVPVPFDPQRLLERNYIPIICLAHKRVCLDVVGKFDPGLTHHEDWDFLIRLAKYWDFEFVNDVTCRYYQHRRDERLSARPDFMQSAEVVRKRYEALNIR